jgi:mRNA-degrading endonuclease RelE of RelBE toxin-antitoxin system
MEFIEAPVFTKYLKKYLSEESYMALQDFLLVNPHAGEIMPGTGGFRKLRWYDKRRGKGKRGGLRVIYYFFSQEVQIWLLTIYGKNEAKDLTSEQKKALKSAIDEEKKARFSQLMFRRKKR